MFYKLERGERGAWWAVGYTTVDDVPVARRMFWPVSDLRRGFYFGPSFDDLDGADLRATHRQGSGCDFMTMDGKVGVVLPQGGKTQAERIEDADLKPPEVGKGGSFLGVIAGYPSPCKKSGDVYYQHGAWRRERARSTYTAPVKWDRLKWRPAEK